MAWIELHQSLRTHKKTGRLAAYLKIKDPDHARVKLENLWLWALDNCLDGRLSVAERPLTAEEIAFASGWNGDPSVWLRSLIDANWIDVKKGGRNGKTMHLHDWHDYAGRLVDSRKADAKRKRDGRRRGRPADVLPDGGGTVPNRTVPYPTQPEDGETPAAALPASPGTPDPELRELDRTVAAFGFCAIPGTTAKAKAIADLRRQGISHDSIRIVAGRQEQKDFYEILRSIQKASAKTEFKPSTPAKPRCKNLNCIDGRVIDQAKTTTLKTAFKPCPDCSPPADAKATA